MERFVIILLFVTVYAASSPQDGEGHLKAKPHILTPAFKDKPFVVVWNVNATVCSKYGMDVTALLDEFGIIHNEAATTNTSDQILILYERNFQYFPHFDRKTGLPVNGGLPQNGNLSLLLDVYSNILGQLPHDFRGLGVIDWESWRALFNRMNSSLFVKYRQETIQSVRRQFPDWSYEQQVKYAKFDYEIVTQKYMKSVLEVGRILRPQGHWGFYLYPDCRYYNSTAHDYSCIEEERHRNDEIQWLFDSSTALFPSVYIHDDVKDKPYVEQYIAGRIREALRVDKNRPGDTSIPVLSYHMLTYAKEKEFVDIVDLRRSIGLASLLGGSGVILWGGIGISKSMERCETLYSYLQTTLGPFCRIASITALKCSRDFCNGRGRCVIVKHNDVLGERYLDSDESVEMVAHFISDAYRLYNMLISSSENGDGGRYKLKCQCYAGWEGKHCQWSVH